MGVVMQRPIPLWSLPREMLPIEATLETMLPLSFAKESAANGRLQRPGRREPSLPVWVEKLIRCSGC